MTAAERFAAQVTAIMDIAAQVKKEVGATSAAHSQLIEKWRGERVGYFSLDEACTMEARNRFFGWGK